MIRNPYFVCGVLYLLIGVVLTFPASDDSPRLKLGAKTILTLFWGVMLPVAVFRTWREQARLRRAMRRRL